MKLFVKYSNMKKRTQKMCKELIFVFKGIKDFTIEIIGDEKPTISITENIRFCSGYSINIPIKDCPAIRNSIDNLLSKEYDE